MGVLIDPQIHQLFRDCNVSFKMHFPPSHLDSFPGNYGAISDEYDEHFHQDISAMKNR
jgi:hypothetical protein